MWFNDGLSRRRWLKTRKERRFCDRWICDDGTSGRKKLALVHFGLVNKFCRVMAIVGTERP